jgi:hypothetical protein
MIKTFAFLLVLCMFVVVVAPAALPAAKPSSHGVDIRVLSGKADMVSGGDALVQIAVLGDVSLDKVTVTVNGKDVTKSFRPDVAAKSSMTGHVEGLAMGANTLEASVDGKSMAKLMLTNHPISGPIFYGAHQTPFVCQTEAAGLGPALDADCNAKTVVTYLYKSTEPPVQRRPGGGGGQVDGPAVAPPGFKNYDPSAPRPADMAQATMPDGTKVDYIVRRETGVVNRAIYQFAFIHQPGQPLPDSWTSTPGWNGRLIYEFGGGCRAGYHQAAVPSALDDKFLSKGYAIADSSLNVFGNNCDDVISAETLMMVKEHFIKEFGMPVHTLSTGPSGGSMQQHLITQNYPGLIDGIMPERTYPDITTVLTDITDCALFDKVFKNSQLGWTDAQKTAVSGFATWDTCSKSWMPNYIPGQIAAPYIEGSGSTCDKSIPVDQLYNATSNPKGARCDVYDNEVNTYGRDHKTGFSYRPLDNVGVQYGLKAFNEGQISADQFLELNEKAGGFDADANIVSTRTVADPQALRAAYQMGRVNSGAGGMAYTPIVDFRPYVDPTGNIHDSFRSFVTRARLIAANGNADNQVLITYPMATTGAALTVDPARMVEMMQLLDKWVDNISKDSSSDPQAVKVRRDRPKELSDSCYTADGQKISEPRTFDGPGQCNKLYPPHTDPRMVAGAPLTDNILKCTLKHMDPKDYKQPLSAEQMAKLKAIFPQGVCDYSQPGVEQASIKSAWHKY